MPIIPKYGPNTIPFKLKYRTIQVPIQDNTYTIIFILVPGTHTVKLGAPSPALTTSTLSKGVVGVSGPVNQYMSSSIASTTSWSSSDSSSVFCASQIFHTSAKSQALIWQNGAASHGWSKYFGCQREPSVQRMFWS